MTSKYTKCIGYVSKFKFPNVGKHNINKTVRYYDSPWQIPDADRQDGVIEIIATKKLPGYPEIATEYEVINEISKRGLTEKVRIRTTS